MGHLKSGNPQEIVSISEARSKGLLAAFRKIHDAVRGYARLSPRGKSHAVAIDGKVLRKPFCLPSS
jgi:hypothetical protein